MSKRRASVQLSTRTEDGGRSRRNGGSIIEGNFEGQYTMFLEVDTDKKTPEGYPVRARLTAGKFTDPDGEVIKLDLSETFFNVTVWEEMEAKPPRD